MTSITHDAALIIQKTWRGHIFAKALPYALAQVSLQKKPKKCQIKIYGPQWGDPPLDWELEGNEWDFEEPPHNCGEYQTFEDSEDYDDGDVADYWRERQLYHH